MMNDMPEIHQFLDGFYMSRIGIRMLIGQHVVGLYKSNAVDP
jgi:pyruvate dehydrogenase kinase 2/3/4